MKKKLFIFYILALSLISSVSISQTIDCNPISADDFYTMYGGRNAFSQHSRDAIAAFLGAEKAVINKNYTVAKTFLKDIFDKYPKGSTA